jgi:hypothetical protein
LTFSKRRIIFSLILILVLVSGACGNLRISGSIGDASGSSSFSESLGAKINDQIQESTALAGSSLGQNFRGSGDRTETFSVTNNLGDNANVGFEIKKSKSYSGSYTLSSSSANYAMATEKLDVNKADLIRAFARAQSRYPWNYASSGISVTKGSLKGYTNSAYATLGEATTSQNFRSLNFAQVAGTTAVVDNCARPAKGGVLDVSVRSDTSGTITGYSGSATATNSEGSANYDFTASGDFYTDTWNYFIPETNNNQINYNDITSSYAQGIFSNAKNMRLSTACVVKIGDNSRTTGTDYYSSGTAKDAYVLMQSQYGTVDHDYIARIEGKWYNGKGDFSGKAETAKSATSTLDMTTNSDRIETHTQTRRESWASDGPGGYTDRQTRINNLVTGDVSNFQGHLYAFAYPENDKHVGREEYGSTNSIGLKGKGITTESNRGVSSYNFPISTNYLYQPYQNYRAVDENVWDTASDTIVSTTSNLWEVLPRTQLPTQKVPQGIKTMYNNNGLRKTSGGQGVDVAVIDTGADTLHPDLVMRMADYADPNGAVEYGDSRADPVGHGTHVSGILAADGGFDGKGIWGMASQVNLHVFNVNEYVNGVATDHLDDNAISNAIYRATDLGCDVISMSLGSQATSAAYSDAIKYASDNGVLLVASAGNGIPNDSREIGYPARDENVIAIGAVDNTGKKAAWWSSPGYNDIQGASVNLAAPGVNVYSTYPTYGILNTDTNKIERWYKPLSGTSMAAPHISGLAAKLWSNQRFTPNPLLSEADLVEVFMEGMAKDVITVDTKAFYDASSYIADWEFPTGTQHPGINSNSGDNAISGGPQEYYQALLAYLNKPKGTMKIQGMDCLTGLGIPTLRKGTR